MLKGLFTALVTYRTTSTILYKQTHMSLLPVCCQDASTQTIMKLDSQKAEEELYIDVEKISGASEYMDPVSYWAVSIDSHACPCGMFTRCCNSRCFHTLNHRYVFDVLLNF